MAGTHLPVGAHVWEARVGGVSLLPQECPNCGRLHEKHNFNGAPGPVQVALERTVTAAAALLDAKARYEAALEIRDYKAMGAIGDDERQALYEELSAALQAATPYTTPEPDRVEAT